jgi:hypothetical protein
MASSSWWSMDEQDKSQADRLQLRIDAQLKQRMRGYAVRKHTDLSSLVTAYFLDLLQAEANQQQEVEQL